MRRFGVAQDGGCRCCDSGTASGHNPCTSHEERLINVRADFPLEAAANFAHRLGIDGSWTMDVATNDVVAAFRRVVCADPRVTSWLSAPGGRFVFEQDDFKPSREGLRAAGAPPCAPQAKILGDKPSREGFRAETLPGGF